MRQVSCDHELCGTDEVGTGMAIKIEKHGALLAVFNLDGDFFVTDDSCTHGPGSLSEGCILDDMVVCDFHGGAFNIRTGEVTSPPCMTPLKTYPVRIHEGRIFIEL